MKQMKQQLKNFVVEPIGELNDHQMRRTLGGMRMEIIHTGSNSSIMIAPDDPTYMRAEIIHTG